MKRLIWAIAILGATISVCFGQVAGPTTNQQPGPGQYGLSNEVCVTPTITASQYSANNSLGGVMYFPYLFGARGSGVIQSVRITFKSAQTVEFDVSILTGNPVYSSMLDKATPAIALQDVLLVTPTIKLTNNSSTLGTETVYGADAIGRAINKAPYGVYALVTTTGTPTPASTTDMQLCIGALSDN